MKALYYILNIIWGFPMTFIGAVVAAALIVTKHKPRIYGGCVYFTVGNNWGGLELGLFFLCDNSNSTHTKNHEFGHSIQNAVFGIFMPFIVCIPSAIRYWWRRLRRGKALPPYDSVWFEGQASALGEKYISFWG